MDSLLVSKVRHSVGDRSVYSGDFVDIEPEGVRELSILCPVSKLTGFPVSLQSVVQKISDKDSRLADVLLQELPYIMAPDDVSDDDKLRLLVSRLDSGSFAENDNVAIVLGDVAKEFFPSASVDKVVEQAIKFNSEDSPDPVDVV